MCTYIYIYIYVCVFKLIYIYIYKFTNSILSLIRNQSGTLSDDSPNPPAAWFRRITKSVKSLDFGPKWWGFTKWLSHEYPIKLQIMERNIWTISWNYGDLILAKQKTSGNIHRYSAYPWIYLLRKPPCILINPQRLDEPQSLPQPWRKQHQPGWRWLLQYSQYTPGFPITHAGEWYFNGVVIFMLEPGVGRETPQMYIYI